MTSWSWTENGMVGKRPAKPKPKYIAKGKEVIPVFELQNGWFVRADIIEHIPGAVICDNREDAMNQKLLHELVVLGKDITNFKGSPYYKQYIEFLKEHHPEYLI